MAAIPHQVAIVGAGVIGLSVAVQLVERYPRDRLIVTLISDQFTPHTTSDKAGCILVPFDVRTKDNNTTTEQQLYESNIKKWTRQTFQHLHTLYNSQDAGLVNIQMVHGYYGDQSTNDGYPWWSELTNGFQRVSVTELERGRLPLNVKNIYSFGTYILACVDYLPWLSKRFKERGGIVEKRKIHSLNELSSYNLIINCTGLGAVELVNDPSVYPVRGDTVTIKAPWIKQFILMIDDTHITYIFPRCRDVLLGGTKVAGEWSMIEDTVAAQGILQRCSDIIPSIKTAEITGISCGLRPARSSVRLELVQGNPPVIHCYGHGGQGIVLHWGCALDIVELVNSTLNLSAQQKAKL